MHDICHQCSLCSPWFLFSRTRVFDFWNIIWRENAKKLIYNRYQRTQCLKKCYFSECSMWLPFFWTVSWYRYMKESHTRPSSCVPLFISSNAAFIVPSESSVPVMGPPEKNIIFATSFFFRIFHRSVHFHPFCWLPKVFLKSLITIATESLR